jgi:predicted nuclease with TOPRIM domain
MTKDVWLWLVSGVLGGTSISAFLKYLSTRRFQSISLEEKLRAEMFEQIDGLKHELATLKAELDHWQEKYLTLHKEYTKLKADFDKLTKDK